MAERKPDRINVDMGFTRNLGNFQTMRIDIGLASDRLEGETKEEHFRRVYEFVEYNYLAEFDDTEAEVKEKIKSEKGK